METECHECGRTFNLDWNVHLQSDGGLWTICPFCNEWHLIQYHNHT